MGKSKITLIEREPYGDHFSTVEQVYQAAQQRVSQGRSVFGDALIFPVDENGCLTGKRIGARVSLDPQSNEIVIMAGAHCENI